ncbi:MAG: DUF4867 family protein [Clostridia bacterium]
MILQEIKRKNPQINFVNSSPLFKFHKFEVDSILSYSGKFSPSQANQYIASDDEAEKLQAYKEIESEIFADLPCQFGWCFGGGRKMNGIEWHKSSEVIVACSDFVLILGSAFDIVDGVYDSAKAVGVFVKKGEVIELLPMTLHLAPLAVYETFCSAIILPKGTNLPLNDGIKGEKRAVNKWLLVHEEHEVGIKNGGKIGVVGENITLNV